MKNLAVAVALGSLAASQAAFAVGPEDPVADPGSQTELPTPPEDPKCADGMVWDTESEQCLDAKSEMLDDVERLEAVREYAYAEQLAVASAVLDTMRDQNSDGALTYRGFLARKLGSFDTGMEWYAKALKQNPDNLMARSYMGQGLVEAEEMDLALEQLVEIQQRGGRDSWPERALRLALEHGKGDSY